MSTKDTIRVLYINLTTKTFYINERKELLHYIGGIGVGIKLLDEEVMPNDDVFSESQPIIFSIGPLETIYPAVTKVVSLFRSPLTGELGESYAGMRMGMAIRFAGYDAIVIKGKSKTPIFLEINNNGVEFHSAKTMWGENISESGRLIRSLSRESGLRSIMRIGPAGERLVRYANVNVDTYRHFGRLGLGALFGSKYLKGIVIDGNKSENIQDKSKYTEIYNKIYKRITETDVMEKYHGIGTSINILPLNEIGALPTKNLQNNSFEFAENISGEEFRDKFLTRKLACTGCPIGCIHLGHHRFKYSDPDEYSSKEISYDHELIFSLGSYLGISTIPKILSILDVIEEKGLDCITTGVLLGWVTESVEKGIISEEQLGCKVSFGDEKGYIQLVGKILSKENEIMEDLGMGTLYMAKKYGGYDFAGILAGQEIPGYHTGYGNIIGLITGARHSHLDNGGYAIDQTMTLLDEEKLVSYLINEEVERNIQNCLVICLFSRKIYDKNTILQALDSVGITKTMEDLDNLGKEIFELKNKLKRRLGYYHTKYPIPKRFFETASSNGKLENSKVEEILKLYEKRSTEAIENSTNLFLVQDNEKTYI